MMVKIGVYKLENGCAPLDLDPVVCVEEIVGLEFVEGDNVH